MVMQRRRGLIQRIIDGEPILLSLSSQERPEDIIRRWREKGVPQPAIEMALKMADRWLEAILK